MTRASLVSPAVPDVQTARGPLVFDARPVEGYPSLRAAAVMIGITPSALSRLADIERVPAGREQRIPAAEVVRLAGRYRRRSPNRVAAELVERAIAIDRDLEQPIGAEVDDALQRLPVTGASMTSFLDEARRLLPPVLAEQIERALASQARGESAVGWSPTHD